MLVREEEEVTRPFGVRRVVDRKLPLAPELEVPPLAQRALLAVGLVSMASLAMFGAIIFAILLVNP